MTFNGKIICGNHILNPKYWFGGFSSGQDLFLKSKYYDFLKFIPDLAAAAAAINILYTFMYTSNLKLQSFIHPSHINFFLHKENPGSQGINTIMYSLNLTRHYTLNYLSVPLYTLMYTVH